MLAYISHFYFLKIMAKNILIIEDDEFFRSLIGQKLLFEGFSFSIAKNGQEGVEKTKEVKPDLILLDLLLPVMDGFDVLAAIKKDPSIASIPVIILSNLSSKEEIDKGIALGATDYMIKSQSNPDSIISAVKDIFKKK